MGSWNQKMRIIYEEGSAHLRKLRYKSDGVLGTVGDVTCGLPKKFRAVRKRSKQSMRVSMRT